jgi:hypothetical protein
MKWYRITAHGCDANTKVRLQLTDEQAHTVSTVADAITTASTFGCEPRLSIRESTSDHDPDDDEYWMDERFL